MSLGRKSASSVAGPVSAAHGQLELLLQMGVSSSQEVLKGSGRNEVSRGDGGEGETWGPDLRADPGWAGEFERREGFNAELDWTACWFH